MNIRVDKLGPFQVSQYSREIKEVLGKVIPRVTEVKLASALLSIVNGKTTVFALLDVLEGEVLPVVHGFMFVTINQIFGVCSVNGLFSHGGIDMDSWKCAGDVLKEFAAQKQCDMIRCETTVVRVKEICDALGWTQSGVIYEQEVTPHVVER